MSGVHNEGNSLNSTKEPGFGWMTAFLFLVCFVGLFVLIPLRKVFFPVFFTNPPFSKTNFKLLQNFLHFFVPKEIQDVDTSIVLSMEENYYLYMMVLFVFFWLFYSFNSD